MPAKAPQEAIQSGPGPLKSKLNTNILDCSFFPSLFLLLHLLFSQKVAPLHPQSVGGHLKYSP